MAMVRKRRQEALAKLMMALDDIPVEAPDEKVCDDLTCDHRVNGKNGHD